MTNAEARIVHLEQELRRDELAIAQMQAQIAALQQAVRTSQPTNPYGNGGGGSGNVFWTSNSASVGPATGTSLATLTPRIFTANVYVDSGGSLILVGSSQTIYWWYLDTAPANSIIPVYPNNSNTGWDAVAAGCTAI